MSDDETTPPIDMVRWTFTVNPEHRQAIQTYLSDLGLDVFVQEESQFQVLWDDPEEERDEVVSDLWEIHGAPFDITQEEFHRVGHHLLHDDGSGPQDG